MLLGGFSAIVGMVLSMAIRFELAHEGGLIFKGNAHVYNVVVVFHYLVIFFFTAFVLFTVSLKFRRSIADPCGELSMTGALSPLLLGNQKKLKVKLAVVTKEQFRSMSGTSKAASEALRRVAENVGTSLIGAAIYDAARTIGRKVTEQESKEAADRRHAAAEEARLIRAEKLRKMSEDTGGRQSPTEGSSGSMLPSPDEYFHDVLSFNSLLLIFVLVGAIIIIVYVISLLVEMRVLRELKSSRKVYVTAVNNFYTTVGFLSVGFLSPVFVDLAKYIAFTSLDNSFSEGSDTSATDLIYFLDSFGFQAISVLVVAIVIFTVVFWLKTRALNKHWD